VNASTLRAFTDAVEDLAGTAALQVRGAGPFSEDVVETLRGVPGVRSAVAIITTTFFPVDGPAAGEALSVFAADVGDTQAVKTLRLVQAGERVVDDPLAFLVDPSSIVLTDGFAARIGAKKGDVLRLRTPVGIEPFTVRGILPAGGVGRAFGGNLVLMDVIGAQTILGRDRTIDQVDLALEPGVAVEDAERAVRAVLPEGLAVERPERRGEQIERYLRSYRTLLSGVSGLALLAAIFVVGSTIATGVAARRRELGLLRCVGAGRRTIRRLVLGEAALVGLVGTGVGVPLGLLLARLLLDTVTESASLVFNMAFFEGALAVEPAALVLGVVAGLGAALAAAVLPARDAVSVSPLAAARADAAVPTDRRWPARGAVSAALAATAVALWVQVRWDSAWAGNVAALLADFALVCLFMRHARRVATWVLVPLRPLFGVAGRLAVDRLANIPNPLALAGGVLALGLGLMLMSGTLARSFEESMLDFIRHQVRADLVVASTASTGWIESPLPPAIGDAIAAVPGVARVERIRLAEHVLDGERISIDSLEASAFAPDRAGDFVFAAGDPLEALAAVREERGVIVSRNLARRTGLAPGSPLVLDTPGGRLATTVVGVAVDYVSPRGSVVMARPTYERWWKDSTVTRFHVTLAPGADAAAVRRAIAAGPGAAQGLKVLTQRELYAYHQDAVRRAFRFTTALEVLPLVVAALGLAEALLAVALDRRRELALLRAAGTTRGQLARGVVAEALGVGVLGLAGGLAMGLVLALLWVRVNFTQQLGWDLDLHLATGQRQLAAAAALGVSLVAGFLPARRIARLPVAAALRGE
jgi:putative ABC transport system permease protein